MKKLVIPNPPLMPRPARADVRERWIGRYVRFAPKLFADPDSHDPDRTEILQRQSHYRHLGVGEVLDVGRAGLFLIRWQDGTIQEQAKPSLDFYKDEATAISYGPRLHPMEYGGGDLR